MWLPLWRTIIIIIIIWVGVQFRILPPGSTAASVAYCTSPFSKRSCSGRQVPPASTTRGSPLAAKGGTMGEIWWPNGAWDMHPGFFYMPQICDMGPIILLPFRRKACWGLLSPFKNPTASAGFEPANLGIRGQNATSAPPKPLWRTINKTSLYTLTTKAKHVELSPCPCLLCNQENPDNTITLLDKGSEVDGRLQHRI